MKPSNEAMEIRKVSLSPLKCYFEAKDFLGDQYWLFFGICFVSMLIGGAVPVVLIGPAFAGMVLCMLMRARGERVQFDTMFKGFDYFSTTLVAAVIYMAGVMVLAIPFIATLFGGIGLAGFDQGRYVLVGVAVMAIAVVYWVLIVSVAAIVFMFSICLIVDKKMDGWAAIQAATSGVWKNFWGVLICAIVGQIIYFVGVMMCIVPGILAMPIIFTGHFVMYWKIFGIRAAGADAVVATEVQKAPIQ